MGIPVPIEPHFDPANPRSRQAGFEWIAQMSRGNPSGGYILADGTAVVTNGGQQGEWKDADAEHPVPPEWLAAHPDIPNPQYWSPAFPDQQDNQFWKYVTQWGRDGIGLNVLSAEAKAAVAEVQQGVVEPPATTAPAQTRIPMHVPTPVPVIHGPNTPPHSLPGMAIAEMQAMIARLEAAVAEAKKAVGWTI